MGRRRRTKILPGQKRLEQFTRVKYNNQEVEENIKAIKDMEDIIDQYIPDVS